MSFQFPTWTTAAATNSSSVELSTVSVGAKPPTLSSRKKSVPAARLLTSLTPPSSTTSITESHGFGIRMSTAAAPLGGFRSTTPNLVGFDATRMPISAPAPTLSLDCFSATAATTSNPSLQTDRVFVFGLGSTAGVAPTFTTTGDFATLATATKSEDSVAVTEASQMTFIQLEEQINQWTLELEEQEKVLIEQAKQVSAWGEVIFNNTEKILDVNDILQERMIVDELEVELESVAVLIKKLEESITPLQNEIQKITQNDVTCSETYFPVENLGTQLQQISGNLKEMSDKLCEANKDEFKTDPIIQVCQTLNAHMRSLQWIETTSTDILNKLEESKKIRENLMPDNRRSF